MADCGRDCACAESGLSAPERLRQLELRRDRGLRRLARSTRALWAPREVPRRPLGDVSPLEFLRDHVSQSRPLVLTGLSAADWPCLERWTDEYLLEAAGDAEVSVNFSAAGLGDYVDPGTGWFVKPLDAAMPFRRFWALLGEPGSERSDGADGAVPYLSQQNDSFRAEFQALRGDVPEAVSLGLESFGNAPEAVNLWIGDERSVSSCHKDHYENLYVVVRGAKTFTLLPPAAAPFLHEKQCEAARFHRGSDGLLRPVLDKTESVPWIPVDVSNPRAVEMYPDFARACSVEVTVQAGEMLYLPALWYHQVAQCGLTIAVNYWHDMVFGHHYVHHEFLRAAAGLDGFASDESGDDEFAA